MDENYDASLDSLDYSMPDSSLDIQLDESDFDVSEGFDIGNYETSPEIGEFTIEPEISGELPPAMPVDSTDWDQLTELPTFEEHMETDIDAMMDSAPEPTTFDTPTEELDLNIDDLLNEPEEQLDLNVDDLLNEPEEELDTDLSDFFDDPTEELTLDPEYLDGNDSSLDDTSTNIGDAEPNAIDAATMMEDGTEYEIPHDVEASEIVETEPLENVNDWIGEINPNFDEFDIESPYCNNCGSCAYSVYQRLEGNPEACASAENIGYNSQMEALTGMEQVSMSPGEIEQRLLEQGAGSHAIIGIDRSEGAGHWFNAANIDGKVVAIDGQNGAITDWPPDYGDVVNWEMSVKKEM